MGTFINDFWFLPFMGRTITPATIMPELSDMLGIDFSESTRYAKELRDEYPEIYERFVENNGFADWNLQNAIAMFQSGGNFDVKYSPSFDGASEKLFATYADFGVGDNEVFRKAYQRAAELNDKLSTSAALLSIDGDSDDIAMLLDKYFTALAPNLELSRRMSTQNTDKRVDQNTGYDLNCRTEESVRELGGLLDLYSRGKGRFGRLLGGNQDHLFTKEELDHIEAPRGALVQLGGLYMDPSCGINENADVLRTAYAMQKVNGNSAETMKYLHDSFPERPDAKEYFCAELQRLQPGKK